MCVGICANNKQDSNFWDLVATDGYYEIQMATGLKPTRYPFFITWESDNSCSRNNLFTEPLSLDNWMCVCVCVCVRERGREGENIYVGEHVCESVCTPGCECPCVWVHVSMYVCVCECVYSLYTSLHALQRIKRLFWRKLFKSYSSWIILASQCIPKYIFAKGLWKRNSPFQ